MVPRPATRTPTSTAKDVPSTCILWAESHREQKLNAKPAGFLSYVHLDDHRGRITAFREELSREIGMQLGVEFPIFQDRDDIAWGQNWDKR